MFAPGLLLAVVLAAQSVSPDPAISEPAIRALRAEGQRGVDSLLAQHALLALDAAGEARYRAALDRVCGQADCRYSRLFWYTDLAEAEKAARATHRPILSLRLLGNLDEELSCANSRFFRAVLYSNREISAYLRESFVLHWSSERPVPKVTIDYGDGRVMHRTLTGNSIHYVLDEDGNPVDAIPGLYAPAAFLAELRASRLMYDSVGRLAPDARGAALRMAHGSRGSFSAGRIKQSPAGTSAWVASSLTEGKAAVEVVFLEKVSWGTKEKAASSAPASRGIVSSDLGIDDNSVALIREKRAAAPLPGAGSDADIDRVMKAFCRALAADTERNQQELRPQIRQYFRDHAPVTFEQLNAWVYSTLFLTPRSDAWLGLLPEDVFTGLTAEGIE